MVDRLMQRMDRHLFSTQYFHGSMNTAELSIRGWTLIQNFAPYNPQTIKKLNGSKSPAERLNQSGYHDNWLQNLLISASLGGYRSPPQIPIQWENFVCSRANTKVLKFGNITEIAWPIVSLNPLTYSTSAHFQYWHFPSLVLLCVIFK